MPFLKEHADLLFGRSMQPRRQLGSVLAAKIR
jgi:hypothetical protein